MPRIHFIEHSGTERVIEAEPGKSVMQVATENMVPGILGDCGGSCSCATCHAYVDPAWAGKLPPQSEGESLMLEGAIDPQPTSRLTCQLIVTPELDGMVVRTPASQF